MQTPVAAAPDGTDAASPEAAHENGGAGVEASPSPNGADAGHGAEGGPELAREQALPDTSLYKGTIRLESAQGAHACLDKSLERLSAKHCYIWIACSFPTIIKLM